MRSFLVTLLLLAAPALAVKPGDHLYVRSNDTKLRKAPGLKAPALHTLHGGDVVIWNGAAEKDKEWHAVTHAGKQGFVHRSELMPRAPMPELDGASGKPMSPAAFAGGVGYTKCSFGPPQTTSKGDPAQDAMKAELIYLEELNREKATLAAVEQKNKELHR